MKTHQSWRKASRPTPGSAINTPTAHTRSIVPVDGSEFARSYSVRTAKFYSPANIFADWQGFMEGAIETGEAAAQSLIRSFKPRNTQNTRKKI